MRFKSRPLNSVRTKKFKKICLGLHSWHSVYEELSMPRFSYRVLFFKFFFFLLKIPSRSRIFLTISIRRFSRSDVVNSWISSFQIYRLKPKFLTKHHSTIQIWSYIIQNPSFHDRTNHSIDTMRDSWHFLDSNSMCVDRSMNIHQPWDRCNEDTLDKGVHIHEGRYYRACVTGTGDRFGGGRVACASLNSSANECDAATIL